MADASNVQNEADLTIEELKALLREAESALTNATAQSADELSGLRERLRSAYAHGKDTLGKAAEMAKKQAARADEMIHENPYAAIGVAAGLGALLGFLVARSCLSRD